MKKLPFILLISVLFWSSCEEIPPVLNPNMGGGGNNPTPVENQQRQVLIEEFTGVRCVNCPAGSDAIQTLLGIHGERLVAVSIHAGFFSPPYPENQYDFRTTEGNSLLTYLGEPLGFPTAVVDRKLFNGEQDLQLGQSQWAGFIADDLATPPSVKIGIEPNFNTATRELKVKATFYIQEDIPYPDVHVSVMITESNIVDEQLTPAGKNPNYVHRHVLRGMMTSYDGDLLTEFPAEGVNITRNFTMTLPDAWVAENCHVVVFVHRSGTDKEVYQVHEVKVIE